MRRSHLRLLIILLAGAVAVPVTMRVARGVERRADPKGRFARAWSDDTPKLSGGIELRKLFEQVPDDARPDLNGQWSPRAWNKFQLWLDGLKGRRVHFTARSESIKPWESPDGQRRVSIEFEDLQISVANMPMQFPVIGGSHIGVSSARELDQWFDAPQRSNILVEADLESVEVNQWYSLVSLRDVKVALK